jgi:hypothetical protein
MCFYFILCFSCGILVDEGSRSDHTATSNIRLISSKWIGNHMETSGCVCQHLPGGTEEGWYREITNQLSVSQKTPEYNIVVLQVLTAALWLAESAERVAHCKEGPWLAHTHPTVLPTWWTRPYPLHILLKTAGSKRMESTCIRTRVWLQQRKLISRCLCFKNALFALF